MTPSINMKKIKGLKSNVFVMLYGHGRNGVIVKVLGEDSIVNYHNSSQMYGYGLLQPTLDHLSSAFELLDYTIDSDELEKPFFNWNDQISKALSCYGRTIPGAEENFVKVKQAYPEIDWPEMPPDCWVILRKEGDVQCQPFTP